MFVEIKNTNCEHIICVSLHTSNLGGNKHLVQVIVPNRQEVDNQRLGMEIGPKNSNPLTFA